jgi:hypothetical protein
MQREVAHPFHPCTLGISCIHDVIHMVLVKLVSLALAIYSIFPKISPSIPLKKQPVLPPEAKRI